MAFSVEETRLRPPVKFGKSYFLSRDVIAVSNFITQTITHPDQIFTQKNVKYKKKVKKYNIKTNSHTKRMLTHKNDKYKKKLKNII